MLQWIRNLFQNKAETKLTTREMALKVNELNYQGARNHIKGQAFYYLLRNCWGVLLALILIASIVFQFWLVFEVGKGYLNFQGYSTFLGIVAGENFLQVIGLSAIVVNYLFPNKTKK